jgi:glycosyltransferase involved in cell wall biosynthesis
MIKKKLLIISYYWPPLGGPGSLRPVKFSKYLPQFGIEPIILTRKNVAYHSIDKELGKEAKELRVIKTESLDPARILYLTGLKIYRPKVWQKPIKQGLNFPDHKLPWLPFAYNAGNKVNFDYIFVTAPPFSSFITGYMLAKSTGKPFIMDFRDAWLEFPFMPYKGKAQKKFVTHWERKLTEYASLIITVDENIKQTLIKKYPRISTKIFVIPNGYDPDDFKITEKPEIFTISYLGTIREERNPENFLQAVNELIKNQKINENNIIVKFIGHIEPHYLEKIKKYKFTKTFGHLPYYKAIKEFSSSHLGLMITTGSTYFFPSRQNEYLAAGLPIIVCGKSKGIHLLQTAFEKGYPGWIYNYNNINGIKQKIYDIYKSFKNKKVIKGETPYKEYTRENLTKKVAGLIKSTFIP